MLIDGPKYDFKKNEKESSGLSGIFNADEESFKGLEKRKYTPQELRAYMNSLKK